MERMKLVPKNQKKKKVRTAIVKILQMLKK